MSNGRPVFLQQIPDYVNKDGSARWGVHFNQQDYNLYRDATGRIRGEAMFYDEQLNDWYGVPVHPEVARHVFHGCKCVLV